MKRIYLELSLILFTLSAFAKPIDYLTAKKMAEQVLSIQTKRKVVVEDVVLEIDTKRRNSVQQSHEPAFYIFNDQHSKGFVIVSADGRALPILGYSTEGTFSANEQLPPALESYLYTCSKYIEGLRNGNITQTVQYGTPRKTPEEIVPPLVSSVWGQHEPYNNLAPKGYPAGCLAIAMAQIMYYWNWPESGTGSVSYMNTIGRTAVKFSDSHYDWAHMQDAGNNSEASQLAVSKLCYDCGIAVKMKFTEDGSGAYNAYASRAFVKYFYYSCSKLQLLWRKYMSAEAWNRLLKSELDAKRPILYSAIDPEAGGHAFVVDGYDSDFNVHVNWGWYGKYNGYYALTNLEIRADDLLFSDNHQMICGIEPDYTFSDNKIQQLPAIIDSPYVDTTQVAVIDSFTIVARGVANPTPASYINAMIALCDINGKPILHIDSLIRDPKLMIPFNESLDNLSIRIKLPEQNYQDGYYMLRFYFQESGFKDWMLPLEYDGPNAIFLKIENGVIYFNEIPLGIKDTPIAQQGIPIVFDLQGRKRNSFQKGINIVDGKKILVK